MNSTLTRVWGAPTIVAQDATDLCGHGRHPQVPPRPRGRTWEWTTIMKVGVGGDAADPL